MDQRRWAEGDYSSTNKLTGTIYTDSAKTTAKNLTGLTIKIRIFRRWSSTDLFNKTGSIVTAASGTWSYAVAVGEMPSSGLYLLEVELSQSGEVISTFPVEFHIISGPTA